MPVIRAGRAVVAKQIVVDVAQDNTRVNALGKFGVEVAVVNERVCRPARRDVRVANGRTAGALERQVVDFQEVHTRVKDNAGVRALYDRTRRAVIAGHTVIARAFVKRDRARHAVDAVGEEAFAAFSGGRGRIDFRCVVVRVVAKRPEPADVDVPVVVNALPTPRVAFI